jgi:hypothetical protein
MFERCSIQFQLCQELLNERLWTTRLENERLATNLLVMKALVRESGNAKHQLSTENLVTVCESSVRMELIDDNYGKIAELDSWTKARDSVGQKKEWFVRNTVRWRI